MIPPKVPSLSIAIAVGVVVFAIGSAFISANNSSEEPTASQSTRTLAKSVEMKTEETSRNKTKEVDDPSPDQDEKTESSEPTTTAVPQHIADRFERFIRFAGIINRISELTGNQIDRHEVVGYGRTDVQAAYSDQGKDSFQAVYVIRAGRRNIELNQINQSLYIVLGYIIGLKQNVLRWISAWNGLGGVIDGFQDNFRVTAIDIGYDGELTAERIRVLRHLKMEYLTILEKWIQKLSGDKAKKAELEKVKEMIEEIIVEDLYEKGQKGHRGDYDLYYMQ